jgi:hypothetical protein
VIPRESARLRILSAAVFLLMAKPGAKAGGPKGRTVPVATEISNIERRGHVYYWRARVPARVPDARTPEGKYARFSLSLHQSDHRKACYMARRLNTLLAELALGTRAAMTDKDKLEQIFRAEIDHMSAHLDDVAMVGRRSGRSDDVREMETDSRSAGRVASSNCSGQAGS